MMRFPHNCPNCIPLQSWQQFDFYVHTKDGVAVTLVARYGHHSDDCFCGIEIARQIPDHPLGFALRMAQAQGYFQDTEKPSP